MTTLSLPVLQRGHLVLKGRDYLEVKDPCPVFDGSRWHLFGTGVTAPHTFEVLHAVADRLEGPWEVSDPVDIVGLAGSCVAAPGAVADADGLHLFLQTEYCILGGRVEHLVSRDGGSTFVSAGTALESLPGTGEAGIYDPHPAVVGGERYLVYSAFSVVGQPDVHLARSTTDSWDGSWERLGPVLQHADVMVHNQLGSEGYEWGLEGPQLVELPDGRVLLNAVCFLSSLPAGARQRVFFAVGDTPMGPFDVLGPVLVPPEGNRLGENGHASAVVTDDELVLLFQERSLADPLWRLALARTSLALLPLEER